MEFWIQASCPKCTRVFDEEDYNLSTAIETVFPMMTEKAIMIWDTVYIPLCYKYDISCMIDDILDILENLRTNKSGEINLHWSSNTFANVWNIKWEQDNLSIDSKWGSVLGHNEQLLNSKDTLIITKQKFTYEWKKVLFNVISALKESGYKEDNLSGLSHLISEYEAIDSEGILYK